MNSKEIGELMVAYFAGGSGANVMVIDPREGWVTPNLVGGLNNTPPLSGYTRSNRTMTAAQQKRASRKTKNVKRHRAAAKR